MNTVVGISEAHASNDPGVTFTTYSLGSCIGVALYDPVARAGGLLHFQLPSWSIDPARANAEPAMFADSGMALLLQQMATLGGVERRMRVTLAGGAQMLNDAALFNIGRRNHTAIRKILWQRGMLIAHEDIGGGSPRNLSLRLQDGAAVVKLVGLAAQAA